MSDEPTTNASVVDQVATLLEEAAETHHRVYRITEGDDEDWASWYASWLLDLSELPELLGSRPVRSHLVHALVQCDQDHTAAATDEPWPRFYAAALTRRFASP
jgi:hypothetical protein